MARKDISNKLMIYRSDRQERQNGAVWGKNLCLKRIKGYDSGEEGGGSTENNGKQCYSQ